jgi:hypothetical protein
MAFPHIDVMSALKHIESQCLRDVLISIAGERRDAKIQSAFPAPLRVRRSDTMVPDYGGRFFDLVNEIKKGRQ